MNYIDTYKADLQREIANINDTVFDLVILNTPTIINQVKRRWLYGKGVGRAIIGTYASEEYRLYKMQLNPLAGGNVDLELSGDLVNNLTIRQSGRMFEIFSTDEKFTKLANKYGYEQFGLSEEETHELFTELFEFAIETILNKLWK